MCVRNHEYERVLQLRRATSAPSFLQKNRQAVGEASSANTALKDAMGRTVARPTPFLDEPGVFLYSGQKLNSGELQKEWLRRRMDFQQGERLWSFCPEYGSQCLEFSGVAPPGILGNLADTSAEKDCGARSPWRLPMARPKEAFRKPPRELGEGRSDWLKEPFKENEWIRLAVGDERHRPVAAHTYYDPEQVPHLRRTTERPFDSTHIQMHGASDFGPKSVYESVFYHGRAPGEDRYEEAECQNWESEILADRKILDGKFMRTFATTRQGITDADRCEAVLKDEPKSVARKSTGLSEEAEALPFTVRMGEPYRHVGRPDKEWHARLRENDGSPPYEASTGTYLPRDCEAGRTRRGRMSGTLGKAPWQHGSLAKTAGGVYPTADDFDLGRKPPRSKAVETQVHKCSSRAPVQASEREHLPYRRPVHYGVQIPP